MLKLKMSIASLALCASLVIVGCAPPDDMTPGETKTFNANLDGAQETPPINVQGSANGTFTVDTGTRAFDYEVNFMGLTGPVTVAHLHNAPAGAAGAIIVNLSADFPADDNGMVTGSGTFSAAQLDELLNGNVYINIHTAEHPDGEIRGQLIEAP